MFQNEIFKMKKCGREVFPFPWTSHKAPCPWKSGYMRVMVPLTDVERRHSRKKCHTLIVRADKVIRIRATA